MIDLPSQIKESQGKHGLKHSSDYPPVCDRPAKAQSIQNIGRKGIIRTDLSVFGIAGQIILTIPLKGTGRFFRLKLPGKLREPA